MATSRMTLIYEIRANSSAVRFFCVDQKISSGLPEATIFSMFLAAALVAVSVVVVCC